MGQNCSTLSTDIGLGMITCGTWQQMVHGANTSFFMLQQTALKHPFTWSAVCPMTWPLTLNMMLAAVASLCWGTFTSITLLACDPDQVKEQTHIYLTEHKPVRGAVYSPVSLKTQHSFEAYKVIYEKSWHESRITDGAHETWYCIDFLWLLKRIWKVTYFSDTFQQLQKIYEM